METDYISRQWLLNEYDKRHKGPPGGARKMIEEAPPADVRPVVRGKWDMSHASVYIKCSVCGEPFMLIPQNFCPNCGADMTGDADG